jgi:hypothetical protein
VGPLCHPWDMFDGRSGTGNPTARNGHVRHAVVNRWVLRMGRAHGWFRWKKFAASNRIWRRAAYANQIVSTLSRQLVPEFGRSFAEKNLSRVVQLAEFYPN